MELLAAGTTEEVNKESTRSYRNSPGGGNKQRERRRGGISGMGESEGEDARVFRQEFIWAVGVGGRGSAGLIVS